MIQVDIIDGQLTTKTDKSYRLSEMVLILLNAVLHYANRALAKSPEKDRGEVKKAIYDMLNIRFSAVLETFAPEFELRPNLTEKALMEMENKVLENEMSTVQE